MSLCITTTTRTSSITNSARRLMDHSCLKSSTSTRPSCRDLKLALSMRLSRRYRSRQDIPISTQKTCQKKPSMTSLLTNQNIQRMPICWWVTSASSYSSYTISDKVSTYFKIDNATDVQYEEIERYRMAGRNFMVGVNMQFWYCTVDLLILFCCTSQWGLSHSEYQLGWNQHL